MNLLTLKPKVILLISVLCILTGGLAGDAQGQSPVTWINLADTTATGNTLQKTSGQYDAGAISQQQITSAGGYMEFKVSFTHNLKVGFSNDLSASTDYSQLKYYFNFWGNGDFDIREGWSNMYNPGNYTANDLFRIAVENGQVKYYKNGVLLRTSTVTPSFPLVLDTSITTMGGTIQNAVVGTGAPPSGQNVTWINLADTTATGNTLQKTSGQYDAGAISQQQITSTGGYMEFKVSFTHNLKVGLSNDLSASTDYSQLKYYFNFWGNGDFDIREGWSNMYNPGNYTANDLFRIAVENGQVKYYKNGVLLRTSTVTPSYPLVLDTSITTMGGTIHNAVIGTGSPPNDLVVISDPNISFIIGPQLVTGATTNPWAKFDNIALQKGDLFGQAFPKIPPLPQLTGTLSVTNGSNAVVGNGTKFTSEIDPTGAAPYYNGRLRINDGATLRVVQVANVQDDTHLTLVSNWAFATGSGFAGDTYYFDPVNAAWNYDNYLGDAEFYDLALVQYTLYYRTGQTKYRDYARKIADSRWMSEWINYGTVVGGPKDLAPRSMGYAGLFLRALDGRPEFWDYLNRQVQSKFESWVWIRRNDPKIWQDLREGGYANLYAVMLAKVLPDNYPLYGNGTRAASTGQASNGAATRAAYLTQVEKLAKISGADSYFGRLQLANGAWRWDLDNGSLVNLEQPFMVGIYLEGAILLHQLSSDSSVKADIVTQLTKAVTHLFNDGYRTDTVADMPQYQWRGTWYFTRGGPPADPNRCDSSPGVTGCSGDVEKGKPNTTGGDINKIAGERNLQGMFTHAFGYLHKVTGNSQYKTWGDELFDSSFGNDWVPSFPEVDNKQKTFSQNYRSQGRYLVWRLGL